MTTVGVTTLIPDIAVVVVDEVVVIPAVVSIFLEATAAAARAAIPLICPPADVAVVYTQNKEGNNNVLFSPLIIIMKIMFTCLCIRLTLLEVKLSIENVYVHNDISFQL